MAQRKWKKDYGYSDAAMKSLERGTYGKETGRTAKYKTSQEQTQQAKTLPTLKGMTKEPTQVNIQQEMNKEPKTTVSQNSAQKPSTRYQQNVNTEPKKSDRDTTFDKDFDYYWNYRYGDNSGEVDYDRAMDIERPHWETIKEQIKRRNKLSDEEFDSKFEAYNKERTQQAANQEVKQGRDIASKNPILGTLLQALYTPQNMIEGGASMLSNLAPEKYKAQSADDTLFTGTRAKEGIKQTVKDEHIKSNAGKTVYDIGTGLGDMVMAQGIPVLGAAALGTQAAARSNMQALERGVDPNRAAATGAVSGIISGAMNKVGLDKALGSVGKTALGTVAKAAVKEGAENVLEDAANLGVDKLINQNKSQLNTLHDYYVGQGMSDNDAWSQVAKDTGLDLATSFGSGAAFGGLMSGVHNLPALKAELGQYSLDNRGAVDIDALFGRNPELQEIINRDPGSFDKAELAEIKTKKKDVTAQLKQKNAEIRAQEEVLNNAPKKDRVAEKQKLDALNKEAQELQLVKKIYNHVGKGEAVPTKSLLMPNDYNNIFNEQTGTANAINVAVKFAGDTPQAKQLGKEAKQLLTKYVNTGNMEDYYQFLGKVGDLSVLAENTKADYVTKGGTYKYDDIYGGTYTNKAGIDVDNNLYNAIEESGNIPEIVNNTRNKIYKNVGDVHKTLTPDSAPVQRSHKALMPENPYFESDSYKTLSDNLKQTETELDNLENNKKELLKALKNEELGEKPVEEYTAADKLASMFWLDDKPMKYTPEGERIKQTITELDNRIKDLEKRQSEIREGQKKLNDAARVSQLENYQYSDPLAATQSEYQGFDITKGTNSNVQEALDNGSAFISEMSPLEYLQRSAYDIFDDSSLEGTIRSANSYNKIADYAAAMRNGDQFPIPSLTYSGKSGRGQEGRTRALAAYEAGLDKIPVAILGKPSANPNNGRIDYNEPNDFGIPQEDLDNAFIEDLLNEGRGDGQLTPEEIAVLQDVVDGKYDIPETGNEVPTVKPTPERVPEIPNEPPIDTTRLTMNEGVGDTGKSSFFPPEPPITSEPPRSDKMGTSKVGTNSAVNAEIFTKDQIDNDPVISELNKYAKANNEETFNAAKENVLNNGTALLDEYTSGKRNINNDLDVDQSMLLLKGLTDRINEGDTSVEAQRNLLFSKLRQAGTLYGQTIQAFKKWNDTPEGAVINGERLLDKPTSRWKKSNKQQVELNSRIAKALENMGKDNSMNSQPKEPKTHEQIKEGVKNVIEREFGSVEKYFNDNDLEYLTILAENKDIPVWQITDEIEHKMNTGDWYTLDESIEPKKPTNQKLKNALDALVPRETVEKKPLTFDEIRDQVRNTLDKEMAGVNDFSDDDVNYLANLIDSGATKAELTEALNTKMATGRFGISLDTQQKVNDLFTYANRYDPNSKQAIEAKTAAYKLIADETVQNASPWEKFESWRYLAMLGNPKTMVRNFVGNKMFSAVTGVSNNLSAMLEAGTDKLARKLGSDGIQRTKAVLNPIDDRGLIKAAGEDAEAHRYSQLEGTKYEKGTQDAIRKQKSVFNSKLVRLYEQAVDKGISDYGAVKRKYSTSLAGYMKANGLDESAFDADNTYRGLQDISRKRVLTDDERARMESYKGIHDQLEKARDYAVKQAEYATFHEDNAIAKFLTKHSQDYRNSDNVAARGLGYMLEGVVPFKKTPANILISGVEYSPLGALKSIKETGKLIYENTGKRKGNLDDTYTVKGKLTGREREVNKTLAADVLDSWSKTLTGTGLVALGYYLKNKGILNSSNKDEKWQDDLEGIQNYSITINGKTYTLDWAAPAVMPLLMGAEISKLKDRSALLDQKWYDNMDAIGETANALLDPMFETSMLSGIKDTVEEAAKQMQYNDNGAIGGVLGSLATNTATGYLTQGLPTILGQVARTIDNTRRTTDTATSSAMLAPIEKQGRKLMNKIPGLSKLNQPYYDAYGRTQSNSPTNNPIANLAYQMGVPSYIRDINTTDADKQARDVYYGEDENGKPIMDSKVFPAWKSTVKVDGQKLSPEEMATYRKESGEANYSIRDALTKEDWFKDLDADKQAEILKNANTVVDHIGKDAAGFYGKGDDFEAYQKGGVPSLLDRWKGKAADSKANAAMTEAGISTTSNAAKEIKAEMAAGNTEKANQLIEQTKSDTDAAKEAGYVDEEGHVRLADYQKLVRSAGTQSEKMKNDLPKLNELGMDHKALHVYANTVQVIPSVTPNQFVQTYNAINTNTENKITQEEMMNYLNSHNLSDTEAKQIYNAYNDGSWKNKKGVKKTIKKENGKWVDYYPK